MWENSTWFWENAWYAVVAMKWAGQVPYVWYLKPLALQRVCGFFCDNAEHHHELDEGKSFICNPELCENQTDTDDDKSKLTSKQFGLNHRLVMAMQMVGLGVVEAATIMGMLDITHCALRRIWGTITKTIGKVQRDFTATLLEDSLEAVKEISTKLFGLDGNLVPISASVDMGWNTRSSGNAYSSLSGQSVLIGQQTGRPIAYTVMCKSCSLCNAANKKDQQLWNMSVQKILRDRQNPWN